LLPKETVVDQNATAALDAALLPVPVRVFARGFALRCRQTAWLLGAGASADAGVPTAGQLIDELLGILYCSENGVKHADLIRDVHWLDQVHAYYDGRHGLPPLQDNSFYSAIFEKVYPDRDSRARFVVDRLAGRRPHLGQHTLAAMVAAELAPVLITPNFDTLLEDAIRPALSEDGSKRLTVLDPESAGRARFALATDALPLLMKIHGDLGAVTVKNTSAELAEQDERLRKATMGLLGRYGLLVVGYSGRDAAVMAMLRDVLQQPTPYPGGLTWVRRPEDTLNPEVQGLLAAAVSAGVEPVHVVEASGMMELMAEIERVIELPSNVAAHLAVHRPAPLRYPAPPPSGPVSEYPQVRLAALPLLSIPSQARLLKENSGAVSITTMRKGLRLHRVRGVVARRAGGQLVAFGNDDGLAAALAEYQVQVTEETVAIGPEKADDQPDSVDIGVFAETLARALGRTRGITEVLRAGQHHLLRARDEDPRREQDSRALTGLRKAVGGPISGHLEGPGGAHLPWAEAVALGIEWRDGIWRLLFAPEIWVRPDFTDPPSGMSLQETHDAASRLAADFIRARVARRYNSTTGAILAAWARLLTGSGTSSTRTVYAFGLSGGTGIDASFTLSTKPLVSRPLRGAVLRSNT
jgi:hypothetical protein